MEASLLAQVQRADETEQAEISRLLQADEFKDERKALIAKGAPILPVLLRMFLESSSEVQLVRIMSVLRDIDGNKEPFITRVSALARTGGPNLQTAALVTLAQLGTSQHARVFEEVVVDARQAYSARVLAAHGLETLGTEASLKLIATLLPVERTRVANRELVIALETAQGALRKRFQR